MKLLKFHSEVRSLKLYTAASIRAFFAFEFNFTDF